MREIRAAAFSIIVTLVILIVVASIIGAFNSKTGTQNVVLENKTQQREERIRAEYIKQVDDMVSKAIIRGRGAYIELNFQGMPSEHKYFILDTITAFEKLNNVCRTSWNPDHLPNGYGGSSGTAVLHGIFINFRPCFCE